MQRLIPNLLVGVLLCSGPLPDNVVDADITVAVTGTDNAGTSSWEFCGCCTFNETATIGGKDSDGVATASDVWIMSETWAEEIDEAVFVPVPETNTVVANWSSTDDDFHCSLNTTGTGYLLGGLKTVEMGHPPGDDLRGEIGLAFDVDGHMAVMSGDTLCMSGTATLAVDTYHLWSWDSDTLGGCVLDFKTNQGGCGGRRMLEEETEQQGSSSSTGSLFDVATNF